MEEVDQAAGSLAVASAAAFAEQGVVAGVNVGAAACEPAVEVQDAAEI